MKRKSVLALLLGILFALSLTACGSTPQGEAQQASQSGPGEIVIETEEDPASVPLEQPQEVAAEADALDSAAAQEETDPEAGPDTLVIVFSATGTTKGVAEKIAAITGADLYEILPAEPYTADDLNYNDDESRATKEQNDPDARPAIGSDTVDLSGYKTIYLGYPIWWGREPRIMDVFVEQYDFTGKTVIPFCTSGSSGIGQSGQNLMDNAGSGTWLEGQRFDGGVSEEELRAWIEGLR